MPEPVTTVIGFDFGTHWIGAAIGQSLTRQASPLRAIRNGDWEGIGKLIEQWRPQILVVGLPLDMRGQPQEISKQAQRFARRLEGRFGIPAAMVDERLTTREAWQIAIESPDRKSKTDIDNISAVLITESWLRDHDSPAR